MNDLSDSNFEDDTTSIHIPAATSKGGCTAVMAAGLRADNRLDEEGGLWDSSDVARYLKVSRSWVYHRAEAGLLPYLRLGGLLRFDPDTIRAFTRNKGFRP